MGFHWYIDIEEENPGKTFSAGPIILQQDVAMTVTDFVDKVNSAFSDVFVNGEHDALYTIAARTLPMAGAEGASGPSVGQHAHEHVESGVQTNHDNHDNIRPDGPHSHQNQLGNFIWAGAGGQSSTLLATNHEYDAARDARQFIIQYHIQSETTPPRSFKISFNSGEHGQLPIQDVASGADGLREPAGIPPRAEIRVVNKSSVQPLVMKHCKISAMISDKPPVPPDMRFVPYKGINDRLLVLFSPNVGRRTAKPILLATSDSTFIIEEYYSQKDLIVDSTTIGEIEETLEYASDDPVRTYQIFRTETMPTSYSSFIDHHLATVETQLSPQKYSTGVSYLDTLLPNVRYYYCGRSIDRHQNISNPTPITELELVDNNGQFYLSKKIFTFPTIPQRPSRAARRLLAIEPAQLQTAYSLENSNIGAGQAVVGTAPPSNEIGESADPIWDQKFKIRLTSQKTGKKMDLNITFKNSGVANP
tara:strand:+ start:3735 stop:5162 length:1428 start_codon:yes stop_codon:yes gene_type:complete